VEGTSSSPVLPLRPLTLGELLDAAVVLLRRHATVLLPVAAVLTAAEQALLYPLRDAAGLAPGSLRPYDDLFGEFWLLLCAGLGTEAALLVLLGGVAGRAAARTLPGTAATGRLATGRLATGRLLAGRPGRLGALAVLAAVVGAGAGLGALAGLLPWVFVYGLAGLAAPALAVEHAGPGRALLRGLRLAGRAGLRAAWIRLVGYLGWLAIRLALGLGGLALLDATVGLPDGGWGHLVAGAAWAAVNAVAYATLACLDAVLYLETRMRTEGLDIALGRALRRGEPIAPLLAVR
jgi:hypothetical protein